MFNILADIHKRQKAGGAAMLKGIGTAGSYFRSVSLALGDRFKSLAGLSEKEIQKLLKSADGKLSYRDEEMLMAGGSRPEGTQVRQFGTSLRKDADKMTERSIMDFECIMTSGRKDRDNDILNPAGCEIDKHMPLLWQHVPSEPIGKYVQTVLHDDKIVKIHCAIADTPLGRDSAELAEFGALRISHAFLPIKYAPRDEDESDSGDAPFRSGWNVDKFYVMEASLVSIPANEDAIITAFSREKLHSPLIKEYAGSLFSGRKTTVSGIDLSHLSKGGAINVTVNVGGATEEKKPEEKKPSDQAVKKEAEEEPKEEEKKEEPAGEIVSMGAIADLLAQLGKLDLPDEAKNRLSVVAGMLDSVRGAVNEYTDAISAAADDEDLAGLFAGMTELLDEVTGKLGGFCEEAERIASVANLPDSAGEIVSQISSAVGEIQGALSALGTSATDAGSEGAEGEAGGEEEGMEESSMVGDEDDEDTEEDRDEDEDDSELEEEDGEEDEGKDEEEGEDKDDEADEENEKEPIGADDDDVPGWDEDGEDGEEDEDESTGDNEPKSEDDDEDDEGDEAKAASIASKFLGSLIVHEKHDLATLRSIRSEINAKLKAAKS